MKMATLQVFLAVNTELLMYASLLLLAFSIFASPLPAKAASASDSNFKVIQTLPKLSPEEENIIIKKGTERPGSGAYNNTKEAGYYTCRRCGALLYHSQAKFDSGCGWPSFDDAVPGAVKRTPDADGSRVEITCNNCQGHLGHVFEGEGFTAKNTRHCVNSLSMKFVPEKDTETVYFAGGCFWGVEHLFRGLTGVIEATSGYMGGTSENPNYNEVSTGNTGHAEAVRVVFIPKQVSYEQVARLFFEIHDPSELNKQGPDIGTQYRSAVFTDDKAQIAVIKKLMALLNEKGWQTVTSIEPLAKFYPAEDYHQLFIEKNPNRPCHLPVARFDKSPRFK